jgi:hypothetical protein
MGPAITVHETIDDEELLVHTLAGAAAGSPHPGICPPGGAGSADA